MEPRPRPRVEEFGRVSFGLGVLFVLVGIAGASRFVVAAATFAIGLGYFLRDYGRRSPHVLDAMSVYMLAAGIWYGLANLIGYWAIGTSFSTQFPIWRVDEFLDRAQTIAALGVLAPPVGYWLATSMRGSASLPTIGFDVSDKALLRSAMGCVAVAWLWRVFDLSVAVFGTLGALIDNGVNFAVFILSTQYAHGRARNSRAFRRALAALVAAEMLYQLAYSYLRSEALIPLVALLLPYFIAKRISARLFAFGACTALAFALILTPFSQMRQVGLAGSERLVALAETVRTGSSGIQEGAVGLMARLSTFSQLSQICRIVRDEGYKNGETMGYVVFAFIPRVLWPGKPEIAPGQWFAEKLGRGQRLSERRFSNAINMTIPGELFLNFGWLGTFLGGILFGLVLGLTWDAAVLRAGGRNPISLVFTLIILIQMLSSGAHLGFVLSIVFWYLLTLAMTLGYGLAFHHPVPPEVAGIAVPASRSPA